MRLDRNGSVILALVSLLSSALGCGSDGGTAPLGSASSAAPIASASGRAAASSETDDDRKRELRRSLGEVEDEPDLVPDAPGPTPTEANLDVLLGGGAALETLPVRSTDPGRKFDRHLPSRLKPAPPQAPGCNPSDPLCDPL